MAKRTFYIVNVFTRTKYTGNHVAVIRQARQYSEAELQGIARDIGPAAFILADVPERGGWPVRIFTPTVELPFSGHPTLGAAYVIQRELLSAPADSIVIDLPGGRVPVTLTHRGGDVAELSMRQRDASFGATLEAREVAPALGLAPEYLDAHHPVQEVSTGILYVMVPVRTLAALRRAWAVEDRCAELFGRIEARAFTLFCPETASPKARMSVRVFAGYYGVPEDPGTGTANGALAAYLVRHRYFGGSRLDLTVEQGHSIGRPSCLHLVGEERGDAIEVHVGGPVVMVGEGTLR